jgi:predicted AAA+ superfamily ATPase
MEYKPITRTVARNILADCYKQKAIILLGARQVGKSTLLRQLFPGNANDILWLDAENADTPVLLANANEARLKQITKNYKIVIIDEAQKIINIGSVLKLFVDYLPHIQVIATGSSAFDLRNKTSEPLTGRKWEHYLFPLSFAEMVQHTDLITEKRNLHHRIVFGAYPEIVTHDDIERRLRTLMDSYLYKDVLLWSGLKKPEKIIDLLKALAHQVGHEVNYNELGNMLGLKNDTVENYIQILEQTYIIFRLPSYSTNQRKELRKGKKIYFFDTGLRNALISDFRFAELRNDTGQLFENYIISELWKKNSYEAGFGKFYFWRTADQQEIDVIIEKNGTLHTYEIKWNPKAKARLSKTFSGQYPNHTFNVIHRENYWEWISGE